jgi:hypothetical protein
MALTMAIPRFWLGTEWESLLGKAMIDLLGFKERHPAGISLVCRTQLNSAVINCGSSAPPFISSRGTVVPRSLIVGEPVEFLLDFCFRTVSILFWDRAAYAGMWVCTPSTLLGCS